MGSMRILLTASSFLYALGLQVPSSRFDDASFTVQLPDGTWASPAEISTEAFREPPERSRSKRVADLLQVDAPEGEVADLAYMYGRLGDSLWQMTSALLFAEINGCTKVNVALKGRHKIAGFLRPLLLEIPVGKYPGGKTKCNRGQPNNINFLCDATPEDRRRVFIQYIKPLVVPAGKTDKWKGSDPDELVIHVRSGDVFKDAQSCMFLKNYLMECNMPPCAYYDYVIERGNAGKPFNNVRVVSEADMANPCIKQIKSRHPSRKITIQTKTREEDAAAIMNARHLAVSQTLFAWEIAQMNDNLKTLFYMDTEAVHTYHPGGLMPCNQPWNPTVLALHAEGIEEKRPEPAARGLWMTNYPVANISVKSVCGPAQPQFVAAGVKAPAPA